MATNQRTIGAVRSRYFMYLGVLAVVGIGSLLYFVGQSSDEMGMEVDKPTFTDFAESVAYGDVAIVGVVVDPGEEVLDSGLEEAGVSPDDVQGRLEIPVRVVQFEVESVLASGADEIDIVESGATIQVIIDQTIYDGGASEDQKRLTEGDRLVMALQYREPGSNMVTDEEAFTPVGLDNGVLEVRDDALVPWEGVVTSVDEMPLSDIAPGELESILSEQD